MPFAGFKNWAACHSAMMKKYKSDKKANKICGKLQALHEKKHEIDDIKKEILQEKQELIKMREKLWSLKS